MRKQFRYTARRSQVRSPAEYLRLAKLQQESKAARNTKKEGPARAREMVANGDTDFTPKNFTPQKGDDYRGIDFRGADFTGQNFKYNKINRAQGADFSFATFTGGSLEGGFAGASLKNARLRDVTAANAGLAHVDASGASLVGVSLAGARAHKLNLNGAHLNAVNFCEADFDGLTMRGGTLSYSVGDRASLKAAKLIKINLDDVAMNEIDGRNMVFTPKPKAGEPDVNASFHGANFEGATLSAQLLAKAFKDGARLHGATVAEDALDETPQPAPRRRRGDYQAMHAAPAPPAYRPAVAPRLIVPGLAA